MSFTNSGTIVLCRIDYRSSLPPFRAHALCSIRMLHFVFFQFLPQCPRPTCCTVTNQPQHTAERVMWDTQSIPLPVWKAALLFSQSLPWSHHCSWLDQRSGLSHKEPAAWTPCAHNTHAHRDFWPYSGRSSHLGWSLTPPSVTSICSIFDTCFVFGKNITTNNCCLHRPYCRLCCLLRGTEADRKGSFDFDPVLRIAHFFTQILSAERYEINASSIH